MANITSGMNVEVITGKVVPGLKRQADELDRAANDIERLVREAEENWKGNDSKQFAAKWNGGYKGQLKKLVEEIRTFADTARKNAEAQRSTSSTL